ncbi:MAG: restriction endonuclease subunit S, partial [Burkholderiales bacterium]|nr:restriction endonuclease subunit S [Burkholderiales bacterium]
MVKQIPNGYKQTKVGIIPENWQVIKINEILKIGSGKDYKHLNNGNIPVYGTGGYMLSVDKFLYEGDSVCIGRKGTIDKPMFLTDKFWTVDTLFYTHSFRNTIPKFIYFTFQSIDWLKYNEASGVPSLSKSTIELIQIPLPPIKEQEKIAEILSTWDNAITKQEQLIEQKKVFKKSIMQQIFSQKVRFKDENGKEYPVYEQKRLGEICEINKGEQLSKHNMLSSGEYPVLNGGITYSGYINKFNTNENTITISEGGNSCGFVNFISNKFWAGGHCYVLKKVTLSELY